MSYSFDVNMGNLVADWIQERVKSYFDLTGRVFPDTDKGLHFISEENGEAASAWNTIDGDNWVRNNPDDHKETMADFVDELGDVALMAIVTAMSVDANAIGAMIAKIDRKTDEWLADQLDALRVPASDPDPSDFEAAQRVQDPDARNWENPNPWFPRDDPDDAALETTRVDACNGCRFFPRCQINRGPGRRCVGFSAKSPDFQVTIGCQRRRIESGANFPDWICETPRTLCGYRDKSDFYKYPFCTHLDPTSTSPMVDDPDDVYDQLDRTEG